MTNVEKMKEMGGFEDILEEHSEESINSWSAKDVLNAWLEWEGIQGYTTSIINIYEAFSQAPKFSEEDACPEDCEDYQLCHEEIEVDFAALEKRVAGDFIEFDLPKRKLFRDLDHEEEKEFRQWARDNYEPNGHISDLWHPVVQDECNRINKEQSQTDLQEECYESN